MTTRREAKALGALARRCKNVADELAQMLAESGKTDTLMPNWGVGAQYTEVRRQALEEALEVVAAAVEGREPGPPSHMLVERHLDGAP